MPPRSVSSPRQFEFLQVWCTPVSTRHEPQQDTNSVQLTLRLEHLGAMLSRACRREGLRGHGRLDAGLANAAGAAASAGHEHGERRESHLIGLRVHACLELCQRAESPGDGPSHCLALQKLRRSRRRRA